MDLTTKFKTICQIVEEEYHVDKVQNKMSPGVVANKKKKSIIKQEERDFNTKFVKDCNRLNKLVVEFRYEIQALRPKYLLIDEGNDDEEKDYIDDQSSVYLNKLNNLYKNLEKTNAEKCKIDKSNGAGQGEGHGFSSLFSNNVEAKLYIMSMMEIRSNILKYLLNSLKTTTDLLTEMKQIRLNRKRQLNSLSYSNYTNSLQSIPILEEEEETKAHQADQYTQAQLQQLTMENHDLLLSNKNDELIKISRLENSVMEIINLQNELLINLNEQNLQIDKIIENNEFIMGDLQKSNKQLKKAESSFNERGNYLMYLLIFSGVLILLLDFIKP